MNNSFDANQSTRINWHRKRGNRKNGVPQNGVSQNGEHQSDCNTECQTSVYYNMNRILLTLALLLLLINSAQGTDQYEQLINDIDQVRSHANISASIVIISRAEKTLLLQTFGNRSHESESPFASNHYLRLGSISKLFTGLAILALEQKHDFSIDTPIHEYLNKVPVENSWTKQYPVTTAMLLEHTAGLGGMSKKEFSFNDPISIEKAFLIDPDSRKLKWPPGFHSAYSNTGAGIAAHVIEQVSHTSFEAFVHKQVFLPMTLESATYALSPEVNKDLIGGYNTDGITPIPYWHTLYPAFGGINIKAGDMGRVLKIFLGKGSLEGKEIFPESIKRMETPQTSLSAQSGLEYGYGLGLYHFNVEGIPFIGHGGDADGYLAYFAYSRHLNLGYFVLINAFNHKALNNMKDLIQTELVKDSPSPGPPPIYSLAIERSSKILGTYQSATSRFTAKPGEQELEVFKENGDLYTAYKGRKLELVPVNKFHFRRRHENRATIAIIDREGETYLQGDIGNFKKLNTH